MPDTQKLANDLPEESSNTPQPHGTLNPDTAPHSEASLPESSAATHEELAAPSPEEAKAIAEVSAELSKNDPAVAAAAQNEASFEQDRKAVEKDTRAAIHRGLREGLLRMGRLPEYLAHELEKLVGYIHEEVAKL